MAEFPAEFDSASCALDLQLVTRPDRGMRCMIGAAVVALVFHNGFERANVGASVLRPRPFLKLSALHGDVGSRLLPQ